MPTSLSNFSADDRERMYQLRSSGEEWSTIYEKYSEITPSTLRVIYMRMKRSRRDIDLTPQITNGGSYEDDIDEEEAWAKAVAISQKRKRREASKQERTIVFPSGPICIVNMADIHAGSDGTDYDRVSREIDLVNETPGMFFGLAGDLVDNFIVGRLIQIQRDSSFQISEQWAVLRYLLRRLTEKNKLLWSIGGNHDDWTRSLAGIDYFADIHRQLSPETIVDRHEATINIKVGSVSRRWVIRHKWRGNSQWNPLHAIQKGAKFNNAKPFDVGVGAHTHRSGLAGFFNIGTETAVSVLCGAYKRFDNYAIANGFGDINSRTGVAVAQDEQGQFTLFDTLEAAADYMSIVYSGDEGEG